mgnify:CR=1 FL=1
MKLDSHSQHSELATTVCGDPPLSDSPASLRDDLLELTKARLTALVLATTAVGFALAARGGGIEWLLMLHTLLGTALVAAGSSIFNQIAERRRDARMSRTRERPLAAGRITPASAALGATIASVAGIVYLALATTQLAAAIALLTFVVYLAIYTPLKSRSSACTLVGGVSGALPPVIGWSAAGGQLDSGALYLFALLFFWQMPHFLAINWMYREQYQSAGFVMWSNNDDTGRRTAWLALGFSLLLAAASLAQPQVIRSWPTLLAALLLAIPLLRLAVGFFRSRNRASARRLFLFTLAYLPLMLPALLVWA